MDDFTAIIITKIKAITYRIPYKDQQER